MMSLPAVATVLANSTPTVDAKPVNPSDKSSATESRDAESIEPRAVELDDALYTKQVLQLAYGQTEEQVDNFYYRSALELGIDVTQDDLVTLDDPRSSAETTNSGSTATVTSANVRSRTTSRASQSTGITAPSTHTQNHHHHGTLKAPAPLTHSKSSPACVQASRLRRSLSFTEYERFIAQAQARDIVASVAIAGFVPPPEPPMLTPSSAPSLFSVSTRKSYFSIKRSFGRISRLGKSKANLVPDDVKSCIRCRDDFKKHHALHNLPCSHIYCDGCLRVLVMQAMLEETQMPPKCCSKPIPAFIIKSVLDDNQQRTFMNRVLQYNTPKQDRIYCPDTSCGEFIPKRDLVDPKHPFNIECLKCRTAVCAICKKRAHSVGQGCPADWELDTVIQMGKDHKWRRCYNCNILVQMPSSTNDKSTLTTCKCAAQFCNRCSAVWDTNLGCPNNCNGEEEIRQKETDEKARKAREAIERAQQAALEYSTSAEAMAAVKRSRENQELTRLRVRQVAERDRFVEFEQKQKWTMWTRHGQEKTIMLESHVELEQKMRARHAKTHTTLEDRQVTAEMELRQTLKQERKACLIRLRHMEAYCDGLNTGAQVPGRIVTERDLRELGAQYNLRDSMDRLHTSRINVLREKQAQQLEDLAGRQAAEFDRLDTRLSADAAALEKQYVDDEADFDRVFFRRRELLRRRWARVEEITRKMLEEADKVAYGPLPAMEWPDNGSPRDTTLIADTSSAIV